MFSYLAVELADVRPGDQALPQLLGPVPQQVEAGLLQEEGQEAQVAVQVLQVDETQTRQRTGGGFKNTQDLT